MFKKTVAGATLGATTLLWASPASAQDLDSAPQAVVDNLWLVIAGALVFLMQAGFAFVEAGLTVRRTSPTSWRRTLPTWPSA